MNLVAKEYVAANDGNGALIVSNFIGAAQELDDAFFINPYDVKATADVLHRVIGTDPVEKKERMKRMKRVVAERNVFRWAGKFLLELDHVHHNKL